MHSSIHPPILSFIQSSIHLTSHLHPSFHPSIHLPTNRISSCTSIVQARRVRQTLGMSTTGIPMGTRVSTSAIPWTPTTDILGKMPNSNAKISTLGQLYYLLIPTALCLLWVHVYRWVEKLIYGDFLCKLILIDKWKVSLWLYSYNLPVREY